MLIFYFVILTNLLKRRNIVGRIATNLANHHSVLGLNIN
jgi:cyanophycinase-like exopeptidase